MIEHDLTEDQLEAAAAELKPHYRFRDGWRDYPWWTGLIVEHALRMRNEAQLREAITVARTFIEEVARERVDEGQNNRAISVLCYIDDCPALAAVPQRMRDPFQRGAHPMTTDHTNDQTPEAPPAREPPAGYHVWDFKSDEDGTNNGPQDWMWAADGSLFDRECEGVTREQAVAACAAHRDAVLASAKPTEPPPLPDGWTKSETGGYVGPHGDCVMFYNDGAFGLDGYNVTTAELQQMLSHHLGLTAPAADVRALERIADRLEEIAELSGDINIDDGGPGMLALAAQLHGLTGKGAP